MSFTATAWASAQSPSTPLQKLILIILADHYDDSIERACIEVQSLSFLSCCSLLEALNSLDCLEAAGLVQRVGRKDFLLGCSPERKESINIRKSLPPGLRYDILNRDGFKCVYCGATPAVTELQVDHVQPISKGGSNSTDNLVTSCRECNLGKSDKEIS